MSEQHDLEQAWFRENPWAAAADLAIRADYHVADRATANATLALAYEFWLQRRNSEVAR